MSPPQGGLVGVLGVLGVTTLGPTETVHREPGGVVVRHPHGTTCYYCHWTTFPPTQGGRRMRLVLEPEDSP